MNRSEIILMRIVYKLTHNLNRISNIRTSHCKIDQATNQASIHRRIRKRTIVVFGKSDISIGVSAGLASNKHAKDNKSSAFPRMNVNPILSAFDLKTQKMGQLTQIFHFEGLLQITFELFNPKCIIATNDDIIHIIQ